MEVESDPFGFILDWCHISLSQEEILRTCPFAGEPEKLYEQESMDPGGPVVDSTGVVMASPLENTQVTRNDNVTPQETYHTPPEESVLPSSASGGETVMVGSACKNSERAVDLGRDSDAGFSEMTERVISQLHRIDPRSEVEKVRPLERDPGSDEPLRKKPRLLEENEGLKELSAERLKALEVSLRLEIPDSYASIVKEKIKECLEKALEGLKDYGPTLQREIKIHEVIPRKSKLNLSVELNGAPRIVDLEIEESDNVTTPCNSKGKSVLRLEQADDHYTSIISTDLARVDHRREVGKVADITGFRYNVGKDSPSCDNGKATAEHKRVGLRGREQLIAQACDDREGETPIETNIGVEYIHRKCDSGPKEAEKDSERPVMDASVSGTVVSERDCSRRIAGVENIDKFKGDSSKDRLTCGKGKAIAQSNEIALTSGEKRKIQTHHDREGPATVLNYVPKDKDGSQRKEAGVKIIDIAHHRREAENVENSGKVRHEDGKSTAGQARDDREGQKLMEINPGSENVQAMGFNGPNFGKSSNTGEGLRILPSCICEQAKDVRRRAISGALSHPKEVKEVDILEVFKELVETCESHGPENESILEITKKHGITFPHLN